MGTILIDLETTGLLEPAGTEIQYQPYIIELSAVRINGDFEPIGKLTTLVKPPIPISEEITKITGITEQQVAGKPEFPEIYRPLVELFLGCHTFVAHNAPFDAGVLALDLYRMGRHYQFPWPPIHFCTVEQSLHLRGHRLSLQKLYEIVTGKAEITNAHRAENDVMALLDCYRWLKKEAANVVESKE